MHIDHVAIMTKDLEKEKNFFLKYFDCRAGKKYINATKKFSSYFIEFSSGTRIELMSQEDEKDEDKGDRYGLVHLAIDVGSMDAVREMTEKLEKEGIIIAGKPRMTGDGYYESVILDPENNKIELISTIT